MKIGTVRSYQPGDENVRFRAWDESECMASSGRSCADVVRSWIDAGASAFTMTDPLTGKPFALAALLVADAEAMKARGMVWGSVGMLATDAISDNAATVAACAEVILNGWLEDVPSLLAMTCAANELNHAWLERLGFLRVGTVNAGPASEPFFVYELTRRAPRPTVA